MKKLLLLLLVAFTFSVFIPEVEAAQPLIAKAKAVKTKKHRKHRHKKHRKHRKHKRNLAFAPVLLPGQQLV